MNDMLKVAGLHVHYGMIEAVKGIDFTLEQGRITALLGANGAGKSTTLLTLSGLVKASAGSVVLEGVEITNQPTHQIVERGLIQVAEGRQILTRLSVRENLLLGAYRRSSRDGIEKDLERLLALFPRLRERLDGAAGNLSGGEQQMLAIARALMAQPRLLLLDEPSMGLAPLLVEDIFGTLQELNSSGLTILLVEQNVRQALKIADCAYVMETGQIVLSGPSSDLRQDSRVVEAYLGA
jgi:branched-chain amino acid transport system ATP-binding protein